MKRVQHKRCRAREGDSVGRGLLRVCLSAVEGLGLWDAKWLTLLEKLDLAMEIHDAGGWLNLPLSFGCALNALPPVSSCQ